MTRDLVKSKKKILSLKNKNPNYYDVIILNDDFTTMNFVVKVLIMFFGYNLQNATKTMLDIHNFGSAIAGRYSKDVAETLILQVSNYSRINNYPLKIIMKSN